MRKILFIIFLFWSLCVQCQTVGNQTIIQVPIGGGNAMSSLYLPKTYGNTTRTYPLITFQPGRGEEGSTDPLTTVKMGPSQFIYNGLWDGTAVNPLTGVRDSFIVVTLVPPVKNAPISGSQYNTALTYLYANYRIDTNRTYAIGVSFGGGGVYNYAERIATENPCTSWTFFSAVHLPAGVFPMSPAINYCDPWDKILSDSVYMHGFSDPADPQNHGTQIRDIIAAIKPFKPTYYYWTNISPQGHGGWDTQMNPTYHSEETGYTIYEEMLLHSRAPVAAPANTVQTTTVSGVPACITSTNTATITVNFTSVGTFGTGNRYNLYLSDFTGSFSNPTLIGFTPSTLNSGSITGTIPANLLTSGNYKVEVNSTNPAVAGTVSAKFQINLASNSIAPTTTQNIAPGVNGNTLTATLGSVPISNQWYDGVNIIAGATGTSYTPNFLTPGAHVVTLKSTFACGVKTSNAVTVNVAATTSHRIYPTKLADNSINLNGCNGSFKYSHGDTIVLTAAQNPYSYISLSCIDSVTVINEGGQVITTCFNSCGIPGGFRLYNDTHIHVTGTGTVGVSKGFFNTSTGNRGIGVQVWGRSKCIEIDHVENYNKNAGFWIKEEQLDNNCDPNYGYPNWVLDSFDIHDNYTHNTSAEGMYLGSTAPNGTQGTQHPSVWCLNGVSRTDSVAGAVPNTVLPMRLGDFKIHDNIFDSTSRAAIQLSDADSGMSYIYNNRITNSGYEYNSDQGNGIVTGTYTRVTMFGNYINQTYGAGEQFFGSYTKGFNDTILNSGTLNGHSTTSANIIINDPAATIVSTGHTNPDSTGFDIQHPILGTKTDVVNTRVNNQNPNQWKRVGNVLCDVGTKAIPNGINVDTSCGGSGTFCITTKTVARDTCCKIISVTHDSSFIRYTDSLRFRIALKYKNGKWQHLRDSIIAIPHQVDTTITHDSSVNFKTTPVDTVICTTGAVGIFYLNDGTVSFQHVMDTAAYVGVNWLRLNYTLGSGAPYNVGNATANSIHVLLTLNNSSNGAAGYGTKADSLITVAAPDWVTNDNEPAINDSANIAASLSGLSALITVAHNHNIKVADGGFEKTIFLNYVKDLQDRGKTDSANTIISLYSLNMTSAASLHFRLKNDSLLNGYSTMALDANALHWGEPYFDTSVTSLSNYLPEVAHFITRRTGKPVIITELGITNHNCALLTALVKQAIQTARLVFYFDGTGAAGRDIKLQECIKTIVSGL